MKSEAEKLLVNLANSLAIAQSKSADSELSKRRVEKARHALTKATSAIADNKLELAEEICRRGLIHLQIADLHHQNLLDSHQDLTINKAGAEDAILELIEAICKIKILIQYKKLSPSRHLRTRLAAVVLKLQNIMEDYAADHQARHHNEILLAAQAELYRSQFLYARLSGEILLSESSHSRQLHYLSVKAGQLCRLAAHINELKEQRRVLENHLQEALNAFADEEQEELDKFIRLTTIEADALQKFLESSELDGSLTYAGAPPAKLKDRLQELAAVLALYHQDEKAALMVSNLKILRQEYIELKRSIRQGDWPKAAEFLRACLDRKKILDGEISKIINPG